MRRQQIASPLPDKYHDTCTCLTSAAILTEQWLRCMFDNRAAKPCQASATGRVVLDSIRHVVLAETSQSNCSDWHDDDDCRPGPTSHHHLSYQLSQQGSLGCRLPLSCYVDVYQRICKRHLRARWQQTIQYTLRLCAAGEYAIPHQRTCTKRVTCIKQLKIECSSTVLQ